MLTRKQLHISFLLYDFFTKIGFYPFALNLKSGEIRIDNSYSKWCFWWLMIALTAFRALLGTVKSIFIITSPEGAPMEETPFTYNQFVFWAPVYAFPLVFYQYRDVTVTIFNSLLRESARRTTWHNVTLQEVIVMTCLPLNIFILPCSYAFILIMEPMAVYNLFSALEESWQTTPVLFAIAAAEGFIQIYIWSLCVFIGHLMVLFYQRCIEDTEEISNTFALKSRQISWLKSVGIKRALRGMRELELLIRVYNLGYRNIHYITKILTTFWYISFTSYGILVFDIAPMWAYFGLFFGVEFAVLYCILFHKAFAIPMHTKKLKMKLLNFTKGNTAGASRRYFCAWIKSIPPTGIRVANFHLFERMSTPNFLSFGIKNITRTVIAYRSN